jgi:hypothetical protein
MGRADPLGASELLHDAKRLAQFGCTLQLGIEFVGPVSEAMQAAFPVALFPVALQKLHTTGGYIIKPDTTSCCVALIDTNEAEQAGHEAVPQGPQAQCMS